MVGCPNTNHKDWKDIVNKYGERTAWAAYLAWGETIPTLSQVDFYLGENSRVFENVSESQSKAIDIVWESIPELSEIFNGDKQLYQEYLDSIFPDRKVKDIVYHGGTVKDVFTKESVGKSNMDINKNDFGQPRAFYFTTSKESSETYGEVKNVLLDVQNPSILEQSIEDIGFGPRRKNKFSDVRKLDLKGKDGFIIKDIFDARYLETLSTSEILNDVDGTLQRELSEKINRQYGDTIGVFNPEQIHILGSKQDIQKAKEFVKNNASKSKLKGVPEINDVFNENPELANAVYEALGFNSDVNSRLTVSQEGSDGFGYVLGLFNDKSERIGKIVYRSKTYLKDRGFPVVSELHLGFEEDYQGKGYFQDALIELLKYDDSPIFISNGRVINDNVFKAINKLDTSKLNINKIEDGYIITLNTQITPQQKATAQQLYSEYLDSIGVTDIAYHHSEEDISEFTSSSERYFQKELKKKSRYIPKLDDIVFFVKKPLTEEFMSKRKFIGSWGLKIPKTLQFNAGEKIGEGVHPGIEEGIFAGIEGNYDAIDFGRVRDNKTWSEVIAIANPKNAIKLGSKQDIEGFKEFVENNVSKSELPNSNIGNNQYQVDRNIDKTNAIDNNSLSQLNTDNTQLTDIQKVEHINDIIRNILSEIGVGIAVVEEFEQINGRFNPEGALNTANGLVELIELAKGVRGEAALPEEFAHLVDAILKHQDSILYNRLIQMFQNQDLVKEILDREGEGTYEKYYNEYNGDLERLSAEARGKILSKHLMRGIPTEQSPYKSLLDRVIKFFKRVFSRLNGNRLYADVLRADEEFSKIAVKLLGNEIDLNFNLDNVRAEKALNSLNNSVDEARKTLKTLIDIRAKKLMIDKNQMSEEQINKEKARLSQLEYNYGKDPEVLTWLYNGIEMALEDFKELRESTISYKNTQGMSKEKLALLAKHLRKIKGFHSAYTPLSAALSRYIVSEEFIANPNPSIEILSKELTAVLGIVDAEYLNNAMPVFKEFIKQFRGSLIGSNVGGEIFTEEMFDNLMLVADKDIGFAEKWLYSMSNTSDLMLRLIERPVKEANWKRRTEVNEIIRTLQYKQEQLEAKGLSTDFMYERDSNGVLTGEFIKKIDEQRFSEIRSRLIRDLDAKYGRNEKSNPKRNLWLRDYHKWKEANVNPDTGEPKASLYANNSYESLNDAQKDFYNYIIELKQELMANLPENKQNLYLAPQYRKDFMDILRDSKSTKEVFNKTFTLIGDQWIDRESDDMYGDPEIRDENRTKQVLKNFEGHTLERLPVYYSQKLGDPRQLSVDLVSTMSLYADMAISYKYMNEIVDIMELGRDLMRERQIGETRGGIPLEETIKTASRTISSKVFKPRDTHRFMERLNEFYSNQIYGVSQKDEGTFKFIGRQMSIAKTANQLNKYTAMNTYAFNILGASANVLTGLAMTRLETMAGEFFGIKESAKADSIYGQWLPDIISDLGRRRNVTMPSLIMEKFNVHQDYEQATRSIRMNQKNLLSRMFTSGSAFFMNNAGEHYLASKVFLAMAEKYKLKDSSSGREVKLIKAFEVKKDKDGIERLKVKDNITKLDGSEFTEADMMMFSRKIAKMHQLMHGIYNREDMSMWQTYALGRMAFMFRKWMPPAFHRRMSKANFDFDLDQVTEGFYITGLNFMRGLYNDLKQGQLNITNSWSELNDHERGNITRALTEIAGWLAMLSGYILLSNYWEDDRDEWYKNFLLYQIRRQQTEIGVMVPTGYNQLTEGFNILKSPAAAVDYTQNLLNVLRVYDIWKDPLQSGPYKGWNPWVRDIVRPLPYHNAIRRAFYPEESLKVFTNN